MRSASLAWLAVFAYSAAATCPGTFDLVRNGECYMQMYLGSSMYCANAPSTYKSTCMSWDGSQGIVIKSQEDHDYWMSVAKSNRQQYGNVAYGNVLLGIECNDNTQQWQWMDGSAITFKPAIYDTDLDAKCNYNGNYCMWALDPVKNMWIDYCNGYQSVDMYCVIPPDVNKPTADSECADFSRDEEDDICYQIGVTKVNWTESNTICRSFGANLASIHNQQENNFVRRLAVSRGLVDGIMMGGVPAGKQNMFGWIDGTPFDFQNFVPGFPIDGFGDCLAMQTNTVNGPWMNIDCSSKLPYACVRKTTDSEPVCDGGLKAEGTIIYSPGFPYNSSVPCDFLLKVDAGLVVEVEILMLEANSCCDHLELSEGPLGGDIIAYISGDSHSGDTFRSNSSNIVRASWQPNGAVNVKGMMITYRGVPKQ